MKAKRVKLSTELWFSSGVMAMAVILGGSLLTMASEKPEPKKKKEPSKPEPPSEAKPGDASPEQQLGDTPAPPWEVPTLEEKAKAQPVRDTLEKVMANVDSPEKASKVAEKLEEIAGATTADEVEQAAKSDPKDSNTDKLSESAQAVKQAAKTSSPEDKASNAIAQVAQEVTTNKGREKEALAEAAHEVLNPEQQGAPEAGHSRERKYLRKEVLKRMKPLDALDAEIFLAINHLPHNHLMNGFFYFFTFIFSGGAAWYFLMGLALLVDHKRAWPIIKRSVIPLVVATTIVEHPVKAFFRRRRPFIDIIQAIVIGKKPGSWSFPSGHSAAAFAGARQFSLGFPELGWLFYLVAGLVAFSRIYLGDHYPGDVVSGGLSGLAISEAVRRVQ